jgi:hypothetical protein
MKESSGARTQASHRRRWRWGSEAGGRGFAAQFWQAVRLILKCKEAYSADDDIATAALGYHVPGAGGLAASFGVVVIFAVLAVIDAAQAAPDQLVSILQKDVADEAACLRQVVERIEV